MNNLDEFYIRVEEPWFGAQTARIGALSRCPLMKVTFSLNRNGGCGKFSMSVHKDYLQGTISHGDIIHFVGDDTIYYKGVITRIPSVTTEKIVKYEAEGVWFHAEHYKLLNYYDGKAIDDLVDDIVAEFDYSATPIDQGVDNSISAPYTLGDFEPEPNMSAAAAIKLLADVQGNVQYGVDNGQGQSLPKVYFKDLDTSTVIKFFLGKHIKAFDSWELSDRIINTLFMTSKETVGGGLLMLKRDGSTVAALGVRHGVVNMPDLRTGADIWRWAGNFLSQHEDARTIAKITLEQGSDYLWPRGKADVIDAGGVTIASLPIIAVHYTFDGTSGLTSTIELGDESEPTFETEMRDILRTLAVNNNATISLAKIAHNNAEQFAETIRIEAKKSGNYNYFIDTIDSEAVYNKMYTYHLWVRHGELLAPFQTEYSEIWSNSIPTGRETATARLHTKVDRTGKIDFKNEDDLTDFFIFGGGDWAVKTGTSELECFKAGSQAIFYRDEVATVGASNQPFQLPTQYTFSFRVNYNSVGMSSPCIVTFGYQDTNNQNQMRMTNGAGGFQFVFADWTGGVYTSHDSTTQPKDTDYVVEITASNGALNSYKIKSADEVTTHYTSGNFTMFGFATGDRLGMNNWYQSTQSAMFLDWIRFDKIGATEPAVIGFQLTRDAKTATPDLTTLDYLDDGEQHQDVNISGLDTGTDLAARFLVKHPARILGWGLSFKNY